MTKILFFITHTTLDLDHAKMCLYELMLSLKKCGTFRFDRMYIYNTHKEELSNETVLDIVEKYKLSKYISEISVFPYNVNTPKRLSSDMSTIFNFCRRNYSREDRVFILKSDLLLSCNVITDINKIISKSFVFTPPFVTAKSDLTNNQLHSYCRRETFIKSDSVTFYNESYDGDKNNTDHKNGKSPFDEQFSFISCNCVFDFSCHYLTVDCMDYIMLDDKDWGGVNFSNCRHIVTTDTSFTVHKFHEVKSQNRKLDREGCDYLRRLADTINSKKKRILLCLTGYIRTFSKTSWSFFTLLKNLYKQYDIDLVISTYYVQYNYNSYIKGILNFDSEKVLDNDYFIELKSLFQPFCNNVEIVVNNEDTSYTDLSDKTREIYHGYLANNRAIDCVLFNYAMSNEYDTVVKTRFDCILNYVDVENCISYMSSLQTDSCLIVSDSSNPVNDHIYICKHSLFTKLIEHIRYRYLNPRDIDIVDPPHGFTQSFITDNGINVSVRYLVKILRFLNFTVISHRGNLDGPCTKDENKPWKIDDVLQQGFDVEVDVRYINEELWLGHDNAQYKIDYDYLYNRRNNLWIHCKDGDSLMFFNNSIHSCKFNYFYHTDEDYVLTSNGTIWTYPGVKIVNENSVCVLSDDYGIAKYICTDYPNRYKQ